MGLTTFICKVESEEKLKMAIKSIHEHNNSPLQSLQEKYSNEEFAIKDPATFAIYNMLSTNLGPHAFLAPCMEKWTRGENILNGGCFVWFRDTLWLEVTIVGVV